MRCNLPGQRISSFFSEIAAGGGKWRSWRRKKPGGNDRGTLEREREAERWVKDKERGEERDRGGLRREGK